MSAKNAAGAGAPAKHAGGRPPDTRPKIEVRLAHDDLAVLQIIERRTALTADEIVRFLVHFAIWESDDQVGSSLVDSIRQAKAKVQAEGT